MRTAEDYTKEFAAEKAATDATDKANENVFDSAEAQERNTSDGDNSTDGLDFVFDASKYGLKKTNKTKGDGIISDGMGGFYKIEGYERQQKDGLDTDQGKVFSSDLEKHARKYTDFDVSNFNTYSDVEKAVRMLSELGQAEAPEPEEEVYTPSQEVAEAKALVSTWDEHIKNGGLTESIYGFNPVTGKKVANSNSTANWYQNYKDTVKKNLQPQTVNASGSETDYSLKLTEDGKTWIASQVTDKKDKQD